MDHHDYGLERDLQGLLHTSTGRRQSLRWLLGAAAALPILGCGGSSDSESTTTAATGTSGTAGSTGTTATTAGSCSVIPEETGGPYPADGTNSNGGGVVNVLSQSGVVRSDIRSSFGAASARAQGVPLTIKLHVVNANSGCAAAGRFAVYLWHCDRDGNYSLYSNGVTGENYLRGVQEADANGDITFMTIFPGCYAGRMPHVHFEVYPTLAKASSAANRIRTSQFTFPLATCNEVYASSGYSASVRNLAQMSFATDNVFSDGYSLQLATMTGNAGDGYVATLTVAVAA
jgi:protocatechuate 3,4-dioxygenase beta subunit